MVGLMFKELIAGLLIAGLSSDILYLYYAGGWYDPAKWIEVSEIILLYCLVLAGLILASKSIGKIVRR